MNEERVSTADICQAAVVLVVIQVMCWCLDVLRVRDTAIRPRSGCGDQGQINSLLERRASRAVQIAARVIPRCTCTVRALSLIYLLARQGYASDLRLGIRRVGKGRRSAHAWVVNASGDVISESVEQVRDFVVIQIPTRL